jgi:hypothetical protein
MISIFTTITAPRIRGDNWENAFNCYEALADELVIVDGQRYNEKTIRWAQWELLEMPSLIHVMSEWPNEFSWEFIGQQFQKGYEAATGDWVIHADVDFIFHERDYQTIKQACEQNAEAPALSFWKYQFIVPDRYNLKSRLVIAVNKKKYGERIRFDGGGESDLCQPSLDGKLISPDSVPEARVPIYNYEHILKTKEQITEDVERMDRAYYRRFNNYLYSRDNKTAYDGWYEMASGRFKKPSEKIKLTDHPLVMQQTIKNLKPENFGYSGFGLIDRGVYA